MTALLSLRQMSAAAMLIAIGVVIPMVSPLKIVLEPASFTLASHVPIFLAMFISPPASAIVALGTTLGFFLGGFPLVVVLRAATHIVFAVVGALILQKRPGLLFSRHSALFFSFSIGILHAVCEFFVVSAFYFAGDISALYYANGFLFSVLFLVGLGSVAHSMVDFALALFIYKLLCRQNPLFANK